MSQKKMQKIKKYEEKEKPANRWLSFTIYLEDLGTWRLVAWILLLGGIGYFVYSIYGLLWWLNYIGYLSITLSALSSVYSFYSVNPGTIVLLFAHLIFSILLIVLGVSLLRKLKKLGYG